MTRDGFQKRYWPLLDRALREALATPGPALRPFYGMMQYHLGWVDKNLAAASCSPGKRLRPIFCMLACEAVGGQVEQALPAATAIELLHNFSLIHDDIEDDSSTRRHRATVWKVWGMAHGINCGDAMFAISFRALTRLQDRGAPAEVVLGAQRAFAETCVALTEGQYLDMAFESRLDVGVDEYLKMIGNKTAALIACSTRIGALVGGAGAETVAQYAGFGENLGLAFQVIDDILGIWGREAQTGKSTSSDILARKKTLPVVYALHDAELRAIYAQERLSENDVAHAVGILERRRAREYAEQMAREYATRAMACLDRVKSASPAQQALRELGHSLLHRDS